MSQPNNPAQAIAALQTSLAALQSAFGQAVTRLTGVEEKLAAGEPRLAYLEEAAQGFTSRVGALEAVAHEPSNADAARLEALEGIVAQLQEAVTRLGQVARPGRTVMRQKVDDLQAMVAEILTRLPEAPPNEGGTAR